MTTEVLRFRGKEVDAITVDFWDSLANDRGYEERQAARAELTYDWLQSRRISCERAQIRQAFGHFSDHWRTQWKENNLTPGPLDCVAFVLAEMNLRLSARLVDGLAEAVERVILNRPPTLVEDAVQVLTRLHDFVPLGIVCDTGVSGPTMLNTLLQGWEIDHLFDVKAYSHDVGVSKPRPAIFMRVIDALEVRPHHSLHIGDLEQTDIAGAKRLGMMAIRYDGLKTGEERKKKSKADLVVTTWNEVFTALGVQPS